MTTEVITWKEFPTPITKTEEVVEQNVDYKEQLRSKIIGIASKIAIPVVAGMTKMPEKALAAGASADKIREGFGQIIDVFTAIAEPILWFYALIGCIMMATGKEKDAGWNRLKQVGYAYLGIALLPTAFSLLQWLSDLIKSSITM